MNRRIVCDKAAMLRRPLIEYRLLEGKCFMSSVRLRVRFHFLLALVVSACSGDGSKSGSPRGSGGTAESPASGGGGAGQNNPGGATSSTGAGGNAGAAGRAGAGGTVPSNRDGGSATGAGGSAPDAGRDAMQSGGNADGRGGTSGTADGASGVAGRDGGSARLDAGRTDTSTPMVPPPTAGFCTPSGAPIPTLKRVPAVNMPIEGAVEVSAPPDSLDEIWVLEHFSGRVRVVKGGILDPTAIAKVEVRQDPPGREQGLLSIAFSPDFKDDQLFYLFYSAASPQGQTTVDEFKRTGPTSSMRVRNVYAQAHSHQFHNGGQLAFSPREGRNSIFLSIGDNGADGGPTVAQMTEGAFGRIRRINLTTREATTWDRGLRNPYRFSFDPATADLYIADVGDSGDRSEKVFFSPAGKSGQNWGWRGSDNRTGVTYLDELPSDMGSVTGGHVYRGRNPKLAGLCGRYIYGHLKGSVWSIRARGDGAGADKLTHPGLNTTELGSFGVDGRGEIYISSLNGGVWRVDAE